MCIYRRNEAPIYEGTLNAFDIVNQQYKKTNNVLVKY